LFGVFEDEEVSVDCERRGTRIAMAGVRLERGPDDCLSCLAATARMNAGVITVALRGAVMI